ncbi:unnamed protein product [Cladocopium goreaui]|uniref:Uncharacterized protein n=1 Tax=Cladocopium goreaui TaxID=2562237 RepID=A0A9P1G1G1_9DINO|nr:unnamed protein product [Cladocopium goreaui]
MTDIALMSGLANVLREASAALGRLGGRVAIETDGNSRGDKADIQEAALALEQVADTIDSGRGFNSAKVPSLSEKLAAIARGKLSLASEPRVELRPRSRSSSTSSRLSRVSERSGVDEEAIQAFVATYDLDPWVGEALAMLSPSQRSSVIKTPLKVEHARNRNGVVMSRVKTVTPVERRIQIFTKVNELGEGVIDRLSTLTPEQCEAVMDSGMKIQRASNPSGVAMSRISEALRNLPDERHSEPFESRLGDRYRKVRSRSRRRTPKTQEVAEIPQDVKHLMQELGLEVWCGEVLRRLTLWQRQAVVRELGNMHDVRNPTGVVISRIKQIVTPDELLQIFIELNGLDQDVEAKLWELTPEQRIEVLAPGIYVQNVRNTSTAVRSRIGNVLEGRKAMTRARAEEGRSSHRQSRHTLRSRSRRRALSAWTHWQWTHWPRAKGS